MYDPVLKDWRVNSEPVEEAMVEVVSAALGLTTFWKREKREVLAAEDEAKVVVVVVVPEALEVLPGFWKREAPLGMEASECGGTWEPVAADCCVEFRL